jgi:hypothetical protein
MEFHRHNLRHERLGIRNCYALSSLAAALADYLAGIAALTKTPPPPMAQINQTIKSTVLESSVCANEELWDSCDIESGEVRFKSKAKALDVKFRSWLMWLRSWLMLPVCRIPSTRKSHQHGTEYNGNHQNSTGSFDDHPKGLDSAEGRVPLLYETGAASREPHPHRELSDPLEGAQQPLNVTKGPPNHCRPQLTRSLARQGNASNPIKRSRGHFDTEGY